MTIILENICKNYSTSSSSITALRHINLHINAGEIFGIIGKSGAGKSTLLRCVNLLEMPTSGNVIVNGESLLHLSSTQLRQARRHIGMIFQHFNLLAGRNVYENISLPLELAGYTREASKKIIMPLLELTGLETKIHAYPSQLSGGQKQRVAIARALTCDPKVLLCDEMTSALDPETTTKILELLKNIRNQLNLTILLITHEMSVIKACCDRVGILEQGELIEENEVGAFFAYPKTPTAKNFIFSLIQQKLPDVLQQHVEENPGEKTHPLVRLWFLPNTATKPIVAQLINQYQLRVNILQANVEYVKEHPMGMMLIAMDGEREKVNAGLNYLSHIGVNAEIIGHVPNDIITFA